LPSKAVNKYLNAYAEAEASDAYLGQFPSVLYENSLVLPCYMESVDSIRRVTSKLHQGASSKTLVVLVSNHPANLVDETLSLATQHHDKIVSELPSPLWRNRHLSLHTNDVSNIDYLLIDCTGERGLSADEGVGTARKKGMDVSLALWRAGHIRSDWLHTTDADSMLPDNYFQANSETAVGMVFPFKHVKGETSEEIWQATSFYEKKLQHYVDGLAYAQSPYAFHTLGSCIAVRTERYAQVRGFPQRAGAEDFYLLNKLRKLGPIQQAATAPIEILSRQSGRVPFGTGPALNKLLTESDLHSIPAFYHPGIFHQLGLLLSIVEQTKPRGFEQLRIDCNDRAAKPALNAAETIGFARWFQHVESQNVANHQYVQQFHLWFDGWRTLKFVHHLRDHGFANQTLPEIQSGQRDFNLNK